LNPFLFNKLELKHNKLKLFLFNKWELKIGKPNNLKDFDRKKPKGLNRI
jgi:hypothetical protein